MSLSILKERIKFELPNEYHQIIDEEFDRYQMESSRMSPEEDKIGQATLTDDEIKRATTTNQHGKHGLTVVQLQCVKAAALAYNVPNWLKHVDTTLTPEENVDIMRQKGTNTGPTMKELQQIR